MSGGPSAPEREQLPSVE